VELNSQPRLFWLLAAGGTLSVLCYFYSQGMWPYAPDGRLRVVDFSAFWAAGLRVLHNQAAMIYDPGLHTAYQEQLHQTVLRDPLAYPYPPHSLLYVWVLGLFSYPAAWLGIVTASAMIWWTVLCRIAKDRVAAAGMALSLGGATQSIVLGQNGMLSAALITAGLLAIPHRKALAGICFALLTIKPQLGIAIFVALLIWREWGIIRVAVATTLAMAVFVTAIFGPAIWPTFVAGSESYSAVIAARQHQVIEPFMQSVFALLVGRTGFSTGLGIQAICGLIALAIVARVSSLTGRAEIRAAAVIAATLLTTPFLYLYDTTMLTAAAALLLNTSRFSVERGIILGAAVLPGVWFLINVSVVPFAAVTILALAYFQSLASLPSHQTIKG
jgi:hypothetical protein